jgi:hypothetical protein
VECVLVARLGTTGRARLVGLERAEAAVEGRRFRGTGVGDGPPATESRRSGALEGSFVGGGSERGGGGFAAWSRGVEEASSKRHSGERQHRGERCTRIGTTFYGSDQNTDSVA